MPEQRNLILAIVLSVTIILAFQYFYELPRIKEAQRQQPAPSGQVDRARGHAPTPVEPGTVTPGLAVPAPGQTLAQSLADSARVAIGNDRLHGSLALTGGRIDNIVLSDYQVSTAPGAPDVALLNPPGAPDTYFVELGWVPAEEGVAVPGADHGVAGEQRRAAPRPAGDAHLGQRPGAALRARAHARRRLHDQRHPARRQRGRGGGRAAGPTA